ncbi:unnamed protein product [Caenorhabditis sp. 36 PRJEB53466]|nr:unnamed protein product [Caenorhabditis sp. 36 PRJEB53466]
MRMTLGDYLILIQNLFLILAFTSTAGILCKGKKKAASKSAVKKKSNESIDVKSAIKPPVTDVTPSAVEKVKEEKKEEALKEEAKEKVGEKKDGAGTPDKKNSNEKSQKTFPKFEMPTESKKKIKLQENEAEKQEKIKKGFFQEKSDEDDTLEKIDSLKVEQSDRTKRSQKKKK